MSDDQVKRYQLDYHHTQTYAEMVEDCDGDWVKYNDYKAASDRIEELQAENKRLKSMITDVIHDTGDDPRIMAASRAEWATRALAAEAKLAKTMEVVEMIASADVDAVLGQAVDLSCEIIGELMEDEDDE